MSTGSHGFPKALSLVLLIHIPIIFSHHHGDCVRTRHREKLQDLLLIHRTEIRLLLKSGLHVLHFKEES